MHSFSFLFLLPSTTPSSCRYCCKVLSALAESHHQNKMIQIQIPRRGPGRRHHVPCTLYKLTYVTRRRIEKKRTRLAGVVKNKNAPGWDQSTPPPPPPPVNRHPTVLYSQIWISFPSSIQALRLNVFQSPYNNTKESFTILQRSFKGAL